MSRAVGLVITGIGITSSVIYIIQVYSAADCRLLLGFATLVINVVGYVAFLEDIKEQKREGQR